MRVSQPDLSVHGRPWYACHMRRQYIVEQQARGRKALAVLPVHYPKPLLTAMNVLAIELWGPPGAPVFCPEPHPSNPPLDVVNPVRRFATFAHAVEYRKER